jgi:hypothetical protein
MDDALFHTIDAANIAITAWINGTAPNTDEQFAQLAALTHPDMTNVFPSGSHTEGLLSGLRGAHGSNAAFRIATVRDRTRVLFEDERSVMGEFVELQTGAAAVDKPQHARLVTVVCIKDSAAPHGLVLLRLHESYLPDDEAAGLDWSALDA